MVRLRVRCLSSAQTVVIGILLGQVALLPVLPRVALAFGPVPVRAATPPAPEAPPAASPSSAEAPAQPEGVPPPYPPAGSPPPGYPPPANTAPGYPPSSAAPPAYPPAAYPPPAYPRPSRGQANDFDAAGAAAAGARDATADTSGGAWFVLGCLLGPLGVLISYVAEPTAPPARYIGQSPEWASAYSAAYKSAGRLAQGKSAVIGCLVISAVLVALIAASSSTVQ